MSMKKILVIGSGGSGKSTFARRLGARLSLEVIHLDAHHWRAGWVAPPKDEWRRQVEELTRRESWVMDGNFSGTLHQVVTYFWSSVRKSFTLPFRCQVNQFFFWNRLRLQCGAAYQYSTTESQAIFNFTQYHSFSIVFLVPGR